jgi:hypothetical protein
LGLLLLVYLQGDGKSIMPLASVMVALGGSFFVTSIRSKVTVIVSGVLMLAFIGLPYTPTEYIWFRSIAGQNLIYPICLGILIFGAIKNLFFPIGATPPEETWVKLFNSVGILILLIAPWISVLWALNSLGNQINWITPAIITAILVLYTVLRRLNLNTVIENRIPIKKLIIAIKTTSTLISRVFQFQWLATIFTFFYKWTARIIQALIRLLEGDGGLLWSLLFLVLIASIILTNRVH